MVTAIIAKQILQENNDLPSTKKTILYEVMSSKVIPEIVEEFGGKALLVRVGRYFINKELKDNK
jgi:phosphomannomutase